MKSLLFAAFGALFGFILHQAQVTNYDKIVGMFLLDDPHLMGVMGAAIGVAAAGLFILRRARARAVAGGEIDVKPKPMRPWILAAGMLFGAGWALSGT